MTINVNYQGIKLTCEYTFEAGEADGAFCPGKPDSFEVESVRTEHGDNIMELFSDKERCESITEAVMEAHREEYGA